MGKWSHLKKSLQRHQPDLGWQVEVDKYKAVYHEQKTATLANNLAHVKELKATLEKQIKVLNTQLEALSQVLVERFEDEGVTKQQFEGLGTVSLKDEPYASLEDREAFYAWVRGQQLDIFTVNYQTLSSIVKERLEQGDELPPGVKVFMKSSATLRQA